MDQFIKILITILISSVKFAVGPAFAYYNNQFPFNNFQVILYCSAGGMLGVTVFSFFTPYIFKFFHWVKFEYYRLFEKKKLELFSDEGFTLREKFDLREKYKKASRKIFTKKNRRLVGLWNDYGLFGIAALTPVIISIPVGSVIATRYVHNKKKVFLYMFISILFWSTTMTFVFEALHVMNVKDVKEQLMHPKDSIDNNFEIR